MANTFTKCFTATPVSAALLSDRDLLDTTVRVAGDERRATAELLALLAELDTRKLYLGEGYSSLFTYCTKRLMLSESAAYGRITAARAARRYPSVLARLAEGDVTLTSISLLAAHLTDDNHESLLDAARHGSRRDVERLVAGIHAQPDIPASLRRVPDGVRSRVGSPDARARGDQTSSGLLTGPHAAELERTASATEDGAAVSTAVANASGTVPASSAPDSARLSVRPTAGVPPSPPARVRAVSRPVVTPIAADRYLLRVTIDASTHRKLDRARDLLRHTVPNGDPAIVIDRALTALVEQLEKRKAGRLSRPERAVGARSTVTRANGQARPTQAMGVAPKPAGLGRHVAAAVKRAVWARDQGRCAFVGPHGRCSETGFLEYHHVVPFAEGGATDAVNLQLRCRAHNAYEAKMWLGEEDRPGTTAPGR